MCNEETAHAQAAPTAGCTSDRENNKFSPSAWRRPLQLIILVASALLLLAGVMPVRVHAVTEVIHAYTNTQSATASATVDSLSPIPPTPEPWSLPRVAWTDKQLAVGVMICHARYVCRVSRVVNVLYMRVCVFHAHTHTQPLNCNSEANQIAGTGLNRRAVFAYNTGHSASVSLAVCLNDLGSRKW
jgi:hypothetical protein